MPGLKPIFMLAFCNVSVLCIATISVAQEPVWYPRMIAPPEVRTVLQATPIELRPYRPMHFYGNSVRRNHYRGTPLPVPAQATRETGRPFFDQTPVTRFPELRGIAARQPRQPNSSTMRQQPLREPITIRIR